VPSREQTRWKRHQAEKAMRQVRKQIKQNRKTKRPRCKDWTPDNLDDLDALDEMSLPQSERVMPRGERERRQSIMTQALSALAEAQDDIAEPSPAAQTPGRQGVVVEVSSSICRVDLGKHSLVCGLRGSLSAYDTGFTNVVAVGDEVMVSENGSDRGVVEAVLPRRSALARPDVFHSHLQQVIVANADQLLIVARSGLLAGTRRPLPDLRRTQQAAGRHLCQQDRPGRGRRGLPGCDPALPGSGSSGAADQRPQRRRG
jgi:hypothetical protein